MNGVLCAGEALYDFISTTLGGGLAGTTLFEKRPGGSPFNIAVGMARLGIPTSFLVKVGTDEFGVALKNLMISENISPDFIVNGKGQNTTLAMAATDKAGKPEFRFYRDNAAETSLTISDVPVIDYKKFSLYQFGSIALVDSPAADTYIEVFENMKSAGVLTSLDPNIRPLYVNGNKAYDKKIRSLIGKVDILKMSDDDLFWFTGKKDVDNAISDLSLNQSGVVIITEGANGASAFWNNERVHVPGFPVTVAETTGCGDSFMAGFIAKFINSTGCCLGKLTTDILKDSVRYANACAAIVATRFGAANSMPRPREVSEFLDKRS